MIVLIMQPTLVKSRSMYVCEEFHETFDIITQMCLKANSGRWQSKWAKWCAAKHENHISLKMVCKNFKQRGWFMKLLKHYFYIILL